MATSKLPRRATLPSGLVVRIDATRAAAASENLGESRDAVSPALEVLGAEGVLRSMEGEAVDVSSLALADANVLAAFVLRAGLVPERAIELPCENCGEKLEARPSEGLELGPFVDGELDDPELDQPFDFDKAHPIPPVFTSKGVARSLRLAPRTVGEARPLFELDGADIARRPRAVVMALGIAALGKERRATAIADALARAGDDVWTRLGDLWEAAHYPRRLAADVYCSCGARNEVLVPADRIFDRIAAPVDDGASDEPPEGFPALAEFEREAERARRTVYARRGVRNVALIVDAGVPACDEGGEPLLGSYQPPGPSPLGVGETEAEITLYYRSFQSEFRIDPAFDVKGEILETIDHEIEHHLYYLSGHDPMDEEERAVIARDRARVVGKKELARRGAREAGADAVVFFKLVLPVAAVVGVLFLVRSCSH